MAITFGHYCVGLFVNRRNIVSGHGQNALLRMDAETSVRRHKYHDHYRYTLIHESSTPYLICDEFIPVYKLSSWGYQVSVRGQNLL